MSASGHDEDNRVDAVCDDIRRVASAPSEPPGAGAVLPGRVAALPCAGYAPWACRVRFAVSTVCSPCAGRKHRGRQPRGLGFRLAGAVPSPTGGLQLAFTARVDARPLTTSGRLQTCPLVPVGARGSRMKPAN